jgi:capsular polysaccharide biosynthesis protein
MMKKRQLSFISVNPADLIKKDVDLSLEIMNLQNVKVTAGILGPLSITKQPSNSQIKQWIIITGLLSLFTGIFFIFFLEYIDRMKARENK